MAMREAYVLASLIGGLNWGRKSLCVPHYTPRHWWECDLAEITASGYLVEYEIKVSRSDFLADRKKRQGGSRDDKFQQRLESIEILTPVQARALEELQKREFKHELLARRSTIGPCRFWYVVPEGLISLDEVPEWAGLYTVARRKWKYGRLDQQKKAPQLHRQKVDPEIERHMRGVCYYRMLNYILRDGEARQEDRSDDRDAAGESAAVGECVGAAEGAPDAPGGPLPDAGDQPELWRDDQPQLDPGTDDPADDDDHPVAVEST